MESPTVIHLRFLRDCKHPVQDRAQDKPVPERRINLKFLQRPMDGGRETCVDICLKTFLRNEQQSKKTERIITTSTKSSDLSEAKLLYRWCCYSL
ncbi:unnamed protein product [Lasius platythorax]|uniref:Uncharacterized protein n=1 Tax=Lasius platythorax TaxID=488582 RepID=A0AAV2NT97_9HYME